MKSKSIIKTVGTGIVTLFLMMLSVASYSQACPGNQATVTLSGISSPTPTTLEFDVNVANTGTTSMSLVGLAGSVVPSAGLVQSGSTNTLEMVSTPQQGEFTQFNVVNPLIGGTGRLVWTNSPAGSGAKVVLPSGVYKRFARFRLTSSLPLATNGATLTLQNVSGAGQNTTVVTVYCNTNGSSTGLSISTAGTLVVGGPYNLQVCATTAAQTASTDVSCFGGSNGSSTITLSPTPSVSAISYTVDGGLSQSGSLVGGAFTVSGLSAGAHSIVISNAGCTNLTATGVTVGTPNQLTHSVTESACGTYHWAVNGADYTESGTYTATNTSGPCPVAETLHLTITPSTSNTTTASACDTYHWGVNDEDYTASGTYTEVRDCHTEILVLTITPSTSNTTTASACGNYTWSVNSTNYTASGTYSVVNGCHTEILNLTINNSTITTQPASTYICSTVGSTATYSVASNVSGATYVWQYRVVTKTVTNPAWITIDGTNAGTVYSTYNTATLGVTKTTKLPAAGTEYRVLISGGCGVLTSNTAALMIITTTKAGSIAVPATTVCVGGSLTFTLGNYAASSIQWQSASISTAAAPGSFTDIPGATGTTYTLTDAQLTSHRSYRVMVTNACNGGTAYSSVKTITVNAPSVGGTITGGGTVCSAGAGTLKVAGYLGKTQWEYSTDGGNTYASAPKAADGQTSPFSTTSANSTGATYVVTNITADLHFRVRATNGACSVAYSAPVQFTLGTTAVVGTVSPASTTLCPANGTTLTLSGPATGTITWQKSTNFNAVTPTWISSTNHTNTFVTGNLTASTAYRVASTIGSCSTVYSNLAIVTIVAKPVAKPIAKNTTVPAGTNAATALCTTDASKVLTVGAGYVGNIQWQSSTTSTTAGFADIDGATGPSYTVTNPAVGANYFRVRVSNTCGVEVFSAAVSVFYKTCVATKDVVKTPFSVVAYPNPYTENFNLSLTTSSVEAVGVSIYDMTGKLVEKREVNTNEVSDLQVGDRYPSGVYNVVVTQGSEVKTLRVIKR